MSNLGKIFEQAHKLRAQADGVSNDQARAIATQAIRFIEAGGTENALWTVFPVGPEHSILKRLHWAQTDGLPITVVYRDGGGQKTTRHITVSEVGADLVRVFDLDADSPRSFRVDRIQQVLP